MPSWKFAVHPAGGGPGLKPRNRREVTSREPVAALAARWTPAGCRLGGSGGGGLSPQGLRGPEGWASCGAGMGPGGQGGGGGRGSGGEGPASSRSGPAFSPQPARVEAGDWNGDHGVYPGPAPHQPVTSQVTSGSGTSVSTCCRGKTWARPAGRALSQEYPCPHGETGPPSPSKQPWPQFLLH